MRAKLRCLLLTAVGMLLVTPQSTRAQWVLHGRPVAQAHYNQILPSLASDGSGGVIMVWQDMRNGSSEDIYAQRLNAAGVPLWTPGGVVVCDAPYEQWYPRIASDGAGGAIIAWQDFRSLSFDVYAQRLNGTGVAQWTANGVPVSTAIQDQYDIAITADGSGGAIVAWTDTRTGFYYRIYAQRLDAAGVPQWTLDGAAAYVGIATFADEPELVSDGAGGAIIAFRDFGPYDDIAAQRLDAAGVPQWGGWLPICAEASPQFGARIVEDGSGGAVIAWTDQRFGSFDTFAQRVNSAGSALWTTNGLPVAAMPFDQWRVSMTAVGGGRTVFAWEDSRTNVGWSIYAQMLDGTGAAQWTYNGALVSPSTGSHVFCNVAADGAGGAVVAWADATNNPNYDVYAQRIDAYGQPVWTPGGVPVSAAADYQTEPVVVCDGNSIFASWDDFRTGTWDIFAQRIEPRYGEWGYPEPALASISDNPADQGGKVIVRWDASDRDRFSNPEISHYSLWRSTDASAAAAPSTDRKGAAAVSDPRDVGADFAGRAVYAAERPGAAAEYWEWIANQDAIYLPTYSYTAATRQDSIAGEPAIHYFKVFSHSRTTPTRVWESPEMGGYSVDNLAPLAPFALTAQRVGSDVHLQWNRAVAPDLRDYAVYRATSTGVTPVAGNFLTSAEDTVLVDASAPTTALYYIVTAYDVHDNQSAPSNEANVNGSTGVGNVPIPTSLALQSNMPNPFGGETTLRVGLPAKSDVTIEIYDVGGRRVARRTLPAMSAGWQNIAFDGRDDAGRQLASGVYFSRVTAAGETRTQKMVIQR